MTNDWQRHVEDWKKRSQEAARLLSRGEMHEMHGLLHALWSNAVGTAGYDKGKWKRLEALIEKSFRTILGPKVDAVGYMAMIAPKTGPKSQA